MFWGCWPLFSLLRNREYGCESQRHPHTSSIGTGPREGREEMDILSKQLFEGEESLQGDGEGLISLRREKDLETQRDAEYTGAEIWEPVRHRLMDEGREP